MTPAREQQILEELEHILRVVDRMECTLNSLQEKAKVAMRIFKMVQKLDLLPEFDIQKGFRKEPNK